MASGAPGKSGGEGAARTSCDEGGAATIPTSRTRRHFEAKCMTRSRGNWMNEKLLGLGGA
ncbi:MAG: hypothetical protein H0V90_08390 [Blastocatellia bacterium]|nr:hypothetical protein [Blastocatellia bacterium]